MYRSIHGKSGEQGELLSIEYKALSTLRPNPKNARTHTKHQIRQIAESICEFRWTNPVLVACLNESVTTGWTEVSGALDQNAGAIMAALAHVGNELSATGH